MLVQVLWHIRTLDETFPPTPPAPGFCLPGLFLKEPWLCPSDLSEYLPDPATQ